MLDPTFQQQDLSCRNKYEAYPASTSALKHELRRCTRTEAILD